MGSGPPGEPAGHHASDAQQLTEEIERTREQLGAAVEQLVAKADVGSRARAQVADLAGRARSVGAKAGRQAAARAGSTAGVLGDKAAGARRKATATRQGGKSQPGGEAARAPQAVPGSARQAMSKAAGVARDKRVLCSVAAGVALAVAALVIWQRGKR
jgi:hypothetical protein